MVALSIATSAQSVHSAETLIKNGKYLEAAKQLRPLADNGNAEAQLLAAKLFFEGKGVNKDELQGIRYARMAAQNGNDNAADAVQAAWRETKSEALEAAIPQVVTDYVKYNPNTKTTSNTWLLYAEMLIDGNGVNKDEAAGWRIVENSQSPALKRKLKYTFSEKYVKYTLSRTEASSFMDYVTRLSNPTDFLLDVAVADFERKYTGFSPYQDSKGWYPLAKNGNKVAQYVMAQLCYDFWKDYKNKFGDVGSACITIATSHAQKAYKAGLQKAKALYEETQKYQIGQLINSNGHIFKVFLVTDGGRHCCAASKEVRTLSYQGMVQWRQQSGFYLANNELIMKALVTELAKSGADVSGGYWVGSGEVSEFDRNGNFLRSGYYEKASPSLGGQFKTYLILNQ